MKSLKNYLIIFVALLFISSCKSSSNPVGDIEVNPKTTSVVYKYYNADLKSYYFTTKTSVPKGYVLVSKDSKAQFSDKLGAN